MQFQDSTVLTIAHRLNTVGPSQRCGVPAALVNVRPLWSKRPRAGTLVPEAPPRAVGFSVVGSAPRAVTRAALQVLSCDRVLVLGNGRVLEIGVPQVRPRLERLTRAVKVTRFGKHALPAPRRGARLSAAGGRGAARQELLATPGSAFGEMLNDKASKDEGE